MNAAATQTGNTAQQAPGADEGLSLLHHMLVGRSAEDAISAVSGHYHMARGEEGVIVGSFAALREEDVGVPHYRGAIIASLTRGAELPRILAGVLGKAAGYTRGRQRGDFLGRFTPHFFGLFSGTLGPSIGYATGAALSAKLDSSHAAAMVTFGDGTSNSGLLYECLNLASMLHLPVVFVCQNNQYAVSMPAARSIAGASLAARAAAFGMPAVDVDGNDVLAVNKTVGEALGRARNGQGPSFVHALTYRVSGHWSSDPCGYRDEAETARWRLLDPIDRLARSLIDDGALTAEEFQAMQAAVTAQASAAMRFAQEAPWPEPDVILHTHAYAE